MNVAANEIFSAHVLIQAPPGFIWSALTDPHLMKRWLGDPEMNIEIETSWELNAPIAIRGFHHVQFENRGRVLKYEKEKILSYSHLSSVSRLPDKPENYSILEFTLTPEGERTDLALTIRQFPTESIRKHLEFYWRTTLDEIRILVEKNKWSTSASATESENKADS